MYDRERTDMRYERYEREQINTFAYVIFTFSNIIQRMIIEAIFQILDRSALISHQTVDLPRRVLAKSPIFVYIIKDLCFRGKTIINRLPR